MNSVIDKTITKTLIEDEFGRRADFTVGEKSTKKIVPNLNISFDCASGREEYFLNLNRRGVAVTDEKETYTSEKLALKVGDQTDTWYVDAEGDFKWDIVFDKDPRVATGIDHTVTWDLLHSAGLVFYYQDTLEVEWEIQNIDGFILGQNRTDFLANTVRPDKVVGSYAIYGDKKNHIKGEANYGCGKVAHIYRPLCIDAIGKQFWGVLSIVDSVLTITIQANDLDTAIYPLTLDPTIGYNTAGGTNTVSTDFDVVTRFNSAGAGDANPGTIYFYGQEWSTFNDILSAVWDDNAGTVRNQAILSSTTPTVVMDATVQWQSAAITWTGIAASTDYFIGGAYEGSRLYYDTATSGYEDTEGYSRTYDATLNDPWPSGSDPLAWEVSCYLDYTASGGTTLNEGTLLMMGVGI